MALLKRHANGKKGVRHDAASAAISTMARAAILAVAMRRLAGIDRGVSEEKKTQEPSQVTKGLPRSDGLRKPSGPHGYPRLLLSRSLEVRGDM